MQCRCARVYRYRISSSTISGESSLKLCHARTGTDPTASETIFDSVEVLLRKARLAEHHETRLRTNGRASFDGREAIARQSIIHRTLFLLVEVRRG
jgi:hypothetical protein